MKLELTPTDQGTALDATPCCSDMLDAYQVGLIIYDRRVGLAIVEWRDVTGVGRSAFPHGIGFCPFCGVKVEVTGQ